MLSKTEMNMLAKLIAIIRSAMALRVAAPIPNCWFNRLISIAGRATCMLVSLSRLGSVRIAMGLRFF
jgi:hypothetical protein